MKNCKPYLPLSLHGFFFPEKVKYSIFSTKSDTTLIDIDCLWKTSKVQVYDGLSSTGTVVDRFVSIYEYKPSMGRETNDR